jgi:hypothetical protein
MAMEARGRLLDLASSRSAVESQHSRFSGDENRARKLTSGSRPTVG